MGDGLLMDLGRPGIGHSRDLSLLHLTLQVCSDWSWQQSTGQAHTHSLSLCWSPLVTTGHHSGLMGDGLLMDLGRPGIGHLSLLHLTLQVCSDWSWQQSTGQAHTHSLSLCWSPLVTTGHHSGLMGDGLLMDLGRPGIGHLSLLHLTLQVCSDWSWQQSTGQAHTHSLSLCWSPLVTTDHHSGLMGDGLLMDLGRPGIGHLSLLHFTLQVCSDWSWQQSTGQAHTLSLSLSAGHHWSPLVTTLV